MRFAIILALGLVGGTASAAQLLLEPYLGYHMGTDKVDGSFNNKVKGTSYGARIGAQQLGFMFGIDYMTGAWTDNESPSVSIKPENIGLFAGYDFPLLVRAYAEYVFAAKQVATVNGSSLTYGSGNAVKVGVGFKLFPLISLNFEYITATYTKAGGQTLTPNLKSEMYGASVSLPLTF